MSLERLNPDIQEDYYRSNEKVNTHQHLAFSPDSNKSKDSSQAFDNIQFFGNNFNKHDFESKESGSEINFRSDRRCINSDTMLVGKLEDADSGISVGTSIISNESLKDNLDKLYAKTKKKNSIQLIEIFYFLAIIGLGLLSNQLLKYLLQQTYNVYINSFKFIVFSFSNQ